MFIALLARYAVLSDDTRLDRALWFGFMAGCLPWLHVRFGAAAMLAAAAVVLTRVRVRWQAVAAFAIGIVPPLIALCLYSYHITGSLLPYEVWTLLIDEPVFKTGIALRRFAGLWFDIDWGVIAHAPVYLLAFAGLVPMWRQNRRTAIWISLCILSLWIPAAGHNWHGSGTTPLRIVASTVPLLAIPLGAALVHFRRSRWFVVLFAVLAIVSIHNSLQFNAHFARDWPVLHGPTFGGWLTRLAMPFSDAGAPLRNPHVLAWFAVASALFVWPIVRDSRLRRSSTRSWTTVTVSVLATIVSACVAVDAWTGVATRSRFMLEPADVRDGFVAFRLAHSDGMLWSSARGRATLAEMFPNATGTDVKAEMLGAAVVGDEVPVTVSAIAPDGRAGWGTVAVDFGDGSPPTNTWMVGTATARHRYTKPGDYTTTTDAALGGQERVSRTAQVKILKTELIAPYNTEWISGLQPDVLSRPVSLRIDRVTIGGSRIEVAGSSLSTWTDLSGSDFWVWLIGYEAETLRARLHAVTERTSGANRFILVVDRVAPFDPGKVTSVLVCAGPARGKPIDRRSAMFSFAWPSPLAVVGAPVVVTASDLR